MQYADFIIKYEDLPHLGGSTPHVFTLQNTLKQTLAVIGVSHTTNPADPLVEYLKKSFTNFKEIPEPKLVLLEKRLKNIPETIEDSTRLFGEAGATAWLAQSHGIPFLCPEPKYRDTLVALCAQFDPSDVCYRQIGEAMGWRTRKTPIPSTEENLARLIEDRVQYADILGFTPTIAWFMEKHASLFGNQDVGDDAFWRSSNSSFATHPIFKGILHATGNVRNQFIMNTIATHWSEGKNIILVYGDAHILAIEPALEALVKSI